MRFDDDQPVSNDRADSAPVYPSANGGVSDPGAVQVEASDRIDGENQVADREVPRRPTAEARADATRVARPALFERGELDTFNGRWSDVQASFVDEPRRAVQQADALVSDVIAEISNSFATQRGQLEGQWDRHGEVSTEDLRQIFQRYRSFFSRLLGL